MQMDWQALADDELALAFRDEGRQEAFDELVRRHQGRVYAVAYRMTGNREDALDVAQDSLVKAYQKIEKWQPHGGFVPWLMRLTTNQSIDALRRRKRQQTESLDADDGYRLDNLEDEQAAPADRGARTQEIEERVQKALSVLSNSQRAIFVLRHYEGLKLNEIAETMGISVGSVKVHLFRALKKMQVELRDIYDGPEE
jgi:RNA polymerase sigma-70 factor (ECF subfamily)